MKKAFSIGFEKNGGVGSIATTKELATLESCFRYKPNNDFAQHHDVFVTVTLYDDKTFRRQNVAKWNTSSKRWDVLKLR